jgi:hypothetical protein
MHRHTRIAFAVKAVPYAMAVDAIFKWFRELYALGTSSGLVGLAMACRC